MPEQRMNSGGEAKKKFESNVIRIKVISMGDGGCGKSCMIKRYCEGKFVTRYISTIGIDFGVKAVTIDGHVVKVNFWDLSGHPEFYEVRNEFYKDTQGCILVYDVTSRSSFEALDGWLKEANKHGVGEVPIIVCANKCDKMRTVTEQEGVSWAQSRGLRYFETSASSGQNIQEVFDSLFGNVVAKLGNGAAQQ
jgi:DnaJ family protein C protein 27